MIHKVQGGNYSGTIVVPASKSDGQRALLAAALANGESELINLGSSLDESHMKKAIQELGAQVEVKGDSTRIQGVHSFPAEVTLNAGESGLGSRLLTSVCAAHDGVFNVVGEGSLVQRPQTFFEEHLPLLGVSVDTTNGAFPIRVKGPMTGAEIDVDGSFSSQFLSGLLMALPLVDGDSVLNVHSLKSKPYVDMTCATLKAFGIEIERNGPDCFAIRGNQSYVPCRYETDADWSSASYWLAAAAMGHEIQMTGLRQNSLQADKAMLTALQSAGCEIIAENSAIRVDGRNRTPFEFDATDCPDLFPSLVAFAASIDGESTIHGVDRLAGKESNRGLTLQSQYRCLGVRIELAGDVMKVKANGRIDGGEVDSCNDHRIAMSLAIAGMFADGEVVIHGAEVVAKSYPDFWNHLNSLSKL